MQTKTMYSKANLIRLGKAIHGFENAIKAIPGSTNMSRSWGTTSTAVVYPCSWRVGILPFLNEIELYERYQFDEPWDSKHNLTLLEEMPRLFRSPFADEAQQEGNTNYLGFSGEISALGTNGVQLQDITDDLSTTLLLVETKHSVPWTKPEDFSFTNYQDAKKVILFDNQGVNFLTADGATHTMLQPIDWGMLGKLITRNGGEKVEMNELHTTPANRVDSR